MVMLRVSCLKIGLVSELSTLNIPLTYCILKYTKHLGTNHDLFLLN